MKPMLFPGAKTPYIFGHRGYSSRAPENTRAAFAACVETGIPGAEMDIHRCATGELVVTHDHNLKRITGNSVIVEETSYSELMQMDIGSWFGPEFAGERTMRLEELFEEFGRDLYFDVELKQMDSKDHGLAAKVTRCIEDFRMQEKVLVSSFNPWVLQQFSRVNPGVPFAHIYGNSPQLPWLLRRGWGLFATGGQALKPHYKQVTWWSDFFYHRMLGRPLIPWTIDDVETARRVLKKGAVGIVSNDPLPLLDLLEGSPRPAP